MSLREKINEAYKDAMRAKDATTVGALRMVNAAIKDKDIATRTDSARDGIDDAAVLTLLQNLIKQRKESITMYVQGGRQELADKEQAEIDAIEKFLPAQMNEADAKAAIQALVTDLGATSIRDMGRVMNELKTRYAGQMDFTNASGWVKTALNN